MMLIKEWIKNLKSNYKQCTNHYETMINNEKHYCATGLLHETIKQAPGVTNGRVSGDQFNFSAPHVNEEEWNKYVQDANLKAVLDTVVWMNDRKKMHFSEIAVYLQDMLDRGCLKDFEL